MDGTKYFSFARWEKDRPENELVRVVVLKAFFSASVIF